MRDAACKSVAVGFFDGVHLGHQAILRGATTAITFRTHPLSVLAPDCAPRLIMSVGDRLDAIRACGVCEVVALDFTESLAQEPPEKFMARLGSRVRCGENWRFGAKGAGDADFLRAHGVEVEVVPYAEYRGGRISSTRIRESLEAGRIADANAMLGRPFSVSCKVFRGKGEGRILGFPTLNLFPDIAVRLPLGAYAVQVNGTRAIANYGVAPTMGDRAWISPCLEIHFPNGQPSMSDVACLKVSFLAFFRPERRFESIKALARQIAVDVRRLEAMES